MEGACICGHPLSAHVNVVVRDVAKDSACELCECPGFWARSDDVRVVDVEEEYSRDA